MQNDAVYQATTAVLRAVVKGDYNKFGEEQKITLPGHDTFDKRSLERELMSLVQRIQHLESKAEAAGQLFPDTPNENGAPSSPFSLVGRHPSPIPIQGGLISVRDGQRNGSSPTSDASDQSHQLEFLHQHVKSQEQEIQENRKIMKNLMEEAEKAKQAPQMPMDEATKVERLQRELKKSQQANEAFSKALREIGEIVTAGTCDGGRRKVDICSGGVAQY